MQWGMIWILAPESVVKGKMPKLMQVSRLLESEGLTWVEAEANSGIHFFLI
jgi:hypothetical protein